MGFNPTFRAKVKQLAHTEETKLKEREIYLSSEFTRYLEMLSSTFMGEYGKPSKVHIIGDGKDGVTAFTNKDEMTLNFESELVQMFETEESRFMSFMGFFFHETAHRLYLDFDTMNMAAKMLEDQGALFPVHTTAEKNFSEAQARVWQEIEAAVKSDEAYRKVIGYVLHQILNILSDVHDEDRMIDDYGSYVSEGILTTREALRATSVPLDVQFAEKKKAWKDLTANQKLIAFFNMVLFYARFNTLPFYDRDVYMTSEFKPVMQDIIPHIEAARYADDMTVRFDEIHHMLVALWPFIQETAQEAQNNQGQGQSQDQTQSGASSQDASGGQGSGQGAQQDAQQGQSGQGQASQNQSSQSQTSPGQSGQGNQQRQNNNVPQNTPLTNDQVNAILDALEKAVKNSGASGDPKNGESSKLAKKEQNPGRNSDGGKKEENKDGRDASKDALYRALKQIKQEIAEEKAEAKVEKEMASSMSGTVMAVEQNSGHKGIAVNFYRKLDVSDADIRTYNTIMADVKAYSKRLQRQILDLMRDLKDGETSKHRPYGKILCPTDAYRVDQKFYANKKLPQDLPNMAVSILCDNSGSMGGSRIMYAMKAAMLLYDFATGINVPVAVAGHTTSGYKVVYRAFSDFERVNDKDKYRIAQMKAENSNRDGMAVEIAASILSKRPEDIKILFVISDGRPNHFNYGGDPAVADIKSIVKKYQNRGVTVIAAAIGTDKDMIKKIYGDGFLDITDLSKLPKTLTNIVRKKIIANL